MHAAAAVVVVDLWYSVFSSVCLVAWAPHRYYVPHMHRTKQTPHTISVKVVKRGLRIFQ